MRIIITITAVLLLFAAVNAQDVVISEINYNSAITFDPEDWIEFYNNTIFTIDLSDWEFKDSNDSNTFVFPIHTFLDAGEFLVLVRDSSDFSALFPEIANYIGMIDFKLSNGGELVRLYDNTGAIVDSLTYDDVAPWPTLPDGHGPTLEKKAPNLDGWDPASWHAVSGTNGTPGQEGWLGIAAELIPGAVAENFCLMPCYPNPFNPATMIIFHLPGASDISLNVFDTQGRQVSALTNGWHAQGIYQVSFDASNLSSGIYIARLTIGDFNQSQKLLLVR